MPWKLKSDRPIYLQLIEKIQLSIISGQFKAGDKLPSVRELAAEASVNPNTMQKALVELERDKLVYSNRTSGRFITEDTKMIEKVKAELAKEQIKEFLDKMEKLGFKQEETIEILLNTTKENK